MIPLDILAPVKLDKFDCLDRRDPEHMELVSSSVMLMLDLFGLVTSSLSDGGSFLVKCRGDGRDWMYSWTRLKEECLGGLDDVDDLVDETFGD